MDDDDADDDDSQKPAPIFFVNCPTLASVPTFRFSSIKSALDHSQKSNCALNNLATFTQAPRLPAKGDMWW